MKLIQNPYTIEFVSVNGREIPADSTENVYFSDEGYQPTSMMRVTVWAQAGEEKEVYVGATGGGTGLHERSYLLESDRLLLCCSDSVFCLSLPNLDLLWRVKADEATCFGLYAIPGGYIVHGELAITRLNMAGEIVWERTGRDIFTTLEGEEVFVISPNRIRVKDWLNYVYVFDYEGNVVGE